MSKGSRKPKEIERKARWMKEAEAIIIAREPPLTGRLGKAWTSLEYMYGKGYSIEEAAKAILDLIPPGAGKDYFLK